MRENSQSDPAQQRNLNSRKQYGLIAWVIIFSMAGNLKETTNASINITIILKVTGKHTPIYSIIPMSSGTHHWNEYHNGWLLSEGFQ